MCASWLVFATLIAYTGPYYTPASTVNAADNASGAFAPNTIGTIYGTNLAYATAVVTPAEVRAGHMPSVLPGTGVRVLVGNIPAGLYYVSPTQINFLIPSILIPGSFKVIVTIDGLHGPEIPIQVTAAAPAFFQLDARNVVATLTDGTVITPQAPAKPGDYVILYATGLGAVLPPLDNLEVAPAAMWLQDLSALQITLDGVAVDPMDIYYAGLAQGFAGLYQINLHLPATVGANPAIRAVMHNQSSPDGITLPVQP